MRILGLDYGDRRIGVAVSDESGTIARGVTTIFRKNREADLDALGVLIRGHQVERIVVGYPLRLDGSEGIQCEKINRFIRRLERHCALPVIRWDETLSTAEAEEILRHRGVVPKEGKKTVDRVAASLILQGYLDALARADTGGLPEIPQDAND
ncbi:MAG: Holliday junction resolvase RuvX [Deltaproteobacteria bacterium]|nr:MAG: Holliday junction resolvase RuvX [Deltaproteobacteria bacterium]